MNSLISKMTGSRITEALPIPATVPSRTARDRGNLRNQRAQRKRASAVAAVMGMVAEDIDEETDHTGNEDGIFPADAVEGEPTNATTAFNRPVKKQEEEPADPYANADGEYLSPAVALVAPDVTPKALVPLDAAGIPGATAQAVFSTAEANAAPEPQVQQQPDAVDTLLGRTQVPVQPAAPAPQASESLSPDQALSKLGITPVKFSEAGETGMLPAAGSGMPEHKDGNPKKIMETFRRWSR